MIYKEVDILFAPKFICRVKSTENLISVGHHRVILLRVSLYYLGLHITHSLENDLFAQVTSELIFYANFQGNVCVF